MNNKIEAGVRKTLWNRKIPDHTESIAYTFLLAQKCEYIFHTNCTQYVLKCLPTANLKQFIERSLHHPSSASNGLPSKTNEYALYSIHYTL